MKRVIILLAVAVLFILPAQAQNYGEVAVGAISELLAQRFGITAETVEEQSESIVETVVEADAEMTVETETEEVEAVEADVVETVAADAEVTATDVEVANVEVANVEVVTPAVTPILAIVNNIWGGTAMEVEVASIGDSEPVVAVADAAEAEVAEPKTPRGRREDGTRFLPMNRRVDRNINTNKFVYRNEVMLGLTASYGTLSVDNSDLLLLLENINIGLKRTTVRPFVAYTYRDNSAVGLRMGYEMVKGNLDNLSLNLGEEADLSFSLGGFAVGSENMSVALFHRNYMGLDRRGIVGVILESELLVKSGLTTVTMGSGEGATNSRNKTFTAKLNLNPGLAVYIFPEVCVTVTVGIGGLSYNRIRQIDDAGVEVGCRQRSNMSFKVNIADIQIGVVAHLWNKKKK